MLEIRVWFPVTHISDHTPPYQLTKVIFTKLYTVFLQNTGKSSSIQGHCTNQQVLSHRPHFTSWNTEVKQQKEVTSLKVRKTSDTLCDVHVGAHIHNESLEA